MHAYVRVDVFELAGDLVRLDLAARNEVEGFVRVLTVPKQDRAGTNLSARDKITPR